MPPACPPAGRPSSGSHPPLRPACATPLCSGPEEPLRKAAVLLESGGLRRDLTVQEAVGDGNMGGRACCAPWTHPDSLFCSHGAVRRASRRTRRTATRLHPQNHPQSRRQGPFWPPCRGTSHSRSVTYRGPTPMARPQWQRPTPMARPRSPLRPRVAGARWDSIRLLDWPISWP